MQTYFYHDAHRGVITIEAFTAGDAERQINDLLLGSNYPDKCRAGVLTTGAHSHVAYIQRPGHPEMFGCVPARGPYIQTIKDHRFGGIKDMPLADGSYYISRS